MTTDTPDNTISTPPAMSWDRLICDKRFGLEHYHDARSGIRSDFQRDFDRLVFSSPFRRSDIRARKPYRLSSAKERVRCCAQCSHPNSGPT